MNEPIEILKELEKNNIEYVVLRGYMSIEKLNTSKDIDIYVPEKYRGEIETFFKKKGWYTTKLNYARFPHKQYICLTSTGFKKIDVVFGLYYGKKLLHYAQEQEIINTREKYEGIYVPNKLLAIETLILHICFDKEFLSETNNMNLKLLLESLPNNSNDNIFVSIAKELVKETKQNKYFKEKQKTILEGGLLTNNRHYRYYMLTFYIKGYILAFLKRIRNSSICFIGVDGAGKTSTIEELEKIFADKITVQYMGFKNFEKKCVNRYMESKKKSKIYKFNVLILQWYDFVYRYFKNRFSKKIVIFDRYPDEAVINFKGIAKIIAYIQYKIFFPRPKNIYYLYCSQETSLKRKNDIADQKLFIEKKINFDKYYLNKNKVVKISTDTNTKEQVINLIVTNLNNKNIAYFL